MDSWALDEIHRAAAIYKEVVVEEVKELRIIFVADNPFSAVLTHGGHGGGGALEGLSRIEKLLEVLALVEIG